MNIWMLWDKVFISFFSLQPNPQTCAFNCKRGFTDGRKCSSQTTSRKCDWGSSQNAGWERQHPEPGLCIQYFQALRLSSILPFTLIQSLIYGHRQKFLDQELCFIRIFCCKGFLVILFYLKPLLLGFFNCRKRKRRKKSQAMRLPAWRKIWMWLRRGNRWSRWKKVRK